MIRLDLARLSRAELERAVTERCSRFGSVVAVVIAQDGARYDFALASVEMSTRAEAIELLRHLGESLMDDAVVIRLEQDPAP
ncbi:MAG: RNA recognition motif domain-containing protein [Betaproteobacteria bacterium]